MITFFKPSNEAMCKNCNQPFSNHKQFGTFHRCPKLTSYYVGNDNLICKNCNRPRSEHRQYRDNNPPHCPSK